MKEMSENSADFLKRFWDRRILSWEGSRYDSAISPILYWQIRYRLNETIRLLNSRTHISSVLELGSGTGRLAVALPGRKYRGIDFSPRAIEVAKARDLPAEFICADVNSCNELLSDFDVTVFLGLTDWLSPPDLKDLVTKLKSPWVLFSFTRAEKSKKWHVYGIYRWLNQHFKKQNNFPINYDDNEIETILGGAGYKVEECRTSPFNPGVLILAKKQ